MTMNSLRETSEIVNNQIGDMIQSRDFSSKQFQELLAQLPEMILTYSNSGYRHEVLDAFDKYKGTLYRIATEMSIEEKQELNKAYVLGYLKASLNMISMINHLAEAKLQDDLPLSIIDKATYVKDILMVLYDRSVIGHNELASHLKIKKNALTMAVRRIGKYNLLESKKYGKYKYYYMTSAGKSIFEKYMGNASVPETSLSCFVNRLLDLVTKSIQDQNADQHKIVEKLTSEFSNLALPRLDGFKYRIRQLNRALQVNRLYSTRNRDLRTDQSTKMIELDSDENIYIKIPKIEAFEKHNYVNF